MKIHTPIRNYRVARVLILAGIFIFQSATLTSQQDTLKVTLEQAEKLFIENNLLLLSEHFNIDIAKARVIQSRLFNNPNIYFSGNIYNPNNKKIGDMTNATGQYVYGFTQLARLAGKRNKEVQLATISWRGAEYQFLELLRTLRYSLRSNFYEVHYLLNSYNAYQRQIDLLEKFVVSYEQLNERGIVTLKDLIRIKSLVYTLKAEHVSLQNEINSLEAELQMLLYDKKYIVPVNEVDLARAIALPPLQSLLDTAFSSRYDLKLAQSSNSFAIQDLALQKAKAVPDLSWGASFDKRGNFADNATFFDLAIDLPVFNRNQGNIKTAKLTVDQNNALVNQQKFIVETEVQTAYLKALNTDRALKSIDPKFRDEFEKILNAVIENFQKKNLTLLEFTDFYESYKTNILQLNKIANERMQALESLYFSIGSTLNK